MRDRALKTLKAPADGALLLVCKKCDGGFARELAASLRASTKEQFGGKHVRVVMTSCLKLCPKKAVAVANVPVNVTGTAPRFYQIREDEMSGAVEEICAQIEPRR